MDLGLKGKKAFVSGSTAGIGRGIAHELAAEGCTVVVHGRNKDRAAAVVREIEAKGGKAFSALGDLGNDAEASRVADEALAAAGTIDILVNNSGGNLQTTDVDWADVPAQEWVDSFSANFLSGLRLSQRFVVGMKAQRWGRIINISSTISQYAFGRLFDYAAPKAALNKFTVDMSKTLGPYNVTANAIVPGTIRTPAIDRYVERMSAEHNWGDDPAERERRYTEVWPQSVPRLGTPRDIGAAVALLASPITGGYINGVCFRVDGGMAVYM